MPHHNCVFSARSMVKEIHLDEGQSPSLPHSDILLLKRRSSRHSRAVRALGAFETRANVAGDHVVRSPYRPPALTAALIGPAGHVTARNVSSD
ncbi:hypothetical protein G5I_09789 [Acromyrmex echinatior]|uniref:Uncharacterized protein n=1 Tax=Acromyrmex echinatior TaxID=103372 RepID=F4WVC2_ACREC|nr:hypothetical protein G5I_09789 [Acromyrmex echinatior]